MGRFQLASLQSKQQETLDRCALATCCSWLILYVVARVNPESAALPWVLIVYMPSWPDLNMQKATGNMQHEHASSFCV